MRLAVSVAVLGACAGSNNNGSYDYASSKGAALYQDMCQVCHGETGEGGLGPALLDTKRSQGELVSIISMRMPANAPGQCTGDCASQIADFIVHGLTSRALRCDRVQPAPRRLRLLTRREYRATVHDLFGNNAPAMTCQRATDCVFSDTCTGGNCEATACDSQTFVFDPQGQAHTSVHVAGSFNGWPQTVAAGGLPLTLQNGLWVGTFQIGEGQFQYKLVLDEQTWIADPRAPLSVPDGFGGQNSVLALSCAGADPTSAFPVENRPAGFPFDTDADAALVTDDHVDAYLDAAEKLADTAAADPNKLSPCSWDGDRMGCAQTLVAQLGRRVFRRPLSGAEAGRYIALIVAGADAKSGVATALHAMLMSPAFLYRSELGTRDGDHYKLTPYEIATALAYTFWGTTPGDDLLAAADAGDLATPAGIEKWARTLIADPRARTQVGEYVLQWVGGQGVETAVKRPDLFPDWTPAVQSALERETREFAAHAVFDGSGTFAELLTANYTVLDPIAAKFYGAATTGVVPYDNRRAGILAHASVLASAAKSDQTSPVQRGLLVRRNLLCEDLPPPPPFGGSLPPIDPNATTRARFEMHSVAPACASCHAYIDPVGFGFEHFDPVGRWRDTENGQAVDGAGDMNDVERLGTNTSSPYSSLPQLAQTIAASGAGPSCFVRQYLRFSRGLRETLAERCGRLWVDAKFTSAGGDVRELMVQSVLSPDFVERR